MAQCAPASTQVVDIVAPAPRLSTLHSFEDLENLLPDDVSRIVEWLTEKVDALSTKLKPEPKDEDEVRGEEQGLRARSNDPHARGGNERYEGNARLSNGHLEYPGRFP